MNILLTEPTEFSMLLQHFFIDRLQKQKNVSPKTIAAYRDTFKLLLTYTEKVLAKTPTKLSIADLNKDLVMEFLTYLENERQNSIRTRNARLAAIRAFANYIALQCPPALSLVQQILAIPMKRYEKPLVGFLSREEIQALIKAPDINTWCGRRDRLMFIVLYNTGARISELLEIRMKDVCLAVSPNVQLHGKGRKQRMVPLWKETVHEIKNWVRYAELENDQPLIPNRQGRAMIRSNVAERFKLALTTAVLECPQLQGRKVSPHIIRHYVPFLTMSCKVPQVILYRSIN
ncbi:tyrosine-type recombinase/integrase [Crocosphaera sp.]|uniref:tyrosine-type recombinase/integrase n=1 Tax=Crocosphaera sp. TaxID=2729996 RepID=UPI00257EAEC9|nr:tyrosine-type recombinase/integrase [Crocosphaera sp.]NQZ65070.1 tyrosine-type recombinase/integrase [Crocosphaera sp.]